MNSLETPVSLDGLVSLDVKKLTSVLEVLFSRLKYQENLVKDNVRSTEAMHGDVMRLNRRVQETEETVASFAHGVEDVNKMKDKVSAWSERFKSLEELHYQLQSDLSSSTSSIDHRFEALEQSRKDTHSSLLTQLKSTQEQRDQKTQDRLAALSSSFEELKIDLRLSIDRVEKDTNARLSEMMGGLGGGTFDGQGKEGVAEGGGTEEEPAEGQPQARDPIKALMVRIRSIEMKLAELPFNIPELPLDSLGLDVDVIHTEIGKDRLILELQNKLFVIVAVLITQQANQFATKLEQMRSNPDPISSLLSQDAHMPKFTKIASIHQRIEEVENGLHEKAKAIAGSDAKFKEIFDRLDALQIAIRDARSKKFTKAPTMHRQSTRELMEQERAQAKINAMAGGVTVSPEAQLFPDGGIEDLREELDSFRSFLESIDETIEKMRKIIMEKIGHDEAEEIATAIVKRAVKTLPSKAGTVQESEGKMMELETRLNNYWRNFQDVQSHIHVLREAMVDQDSKLRHMMDEKLVEMHEPTSASLTALSHKTDAIQEVLSKLTEEKMTEELLENEQYLRSIVLKLKNDVQKTQGEVEMLMNRKVEIQPIIQEINFDDLPEDLESKKFRIVLQQHDQAIRYLANRLMGGTGYPAPDDSGMLGKSHENAAALARMEQLRNEMKEILAKHEGTKPLSAKDMELLNEIYAALDSKIGKEELTAKVDRAELVKIYRQLKKKTDQLSEAVKRAETAGFGQGRDDVFFSKKRLDAECASCGQLLPENCDLQANQYQPWGRFPSRSNLVGPGFSHILQALISSPTGSISIPKKFEEPEERSAPTSPCAPQQRVKRRNHVKLPSVR